MVSPIESTITPLYVGFVIGCFLTGISVGQAFYYYRYYRDDRVFLKLLVATVLVLDLIHGTFITCYLYENIVLCHDNPLKLDKARWPFMASTAINYFITLVAQGFYAFRVWIMSEKNKTIIGIILLLALSQIVCGSGVIAQSVIKRTTSIQEYHHGLVEGFVIADALVSFLCDLLIAASMSYFLLRKRRTGFQRTESIINKLVFFSVSLGLWISFIVLIQFIVYLARPKSVVFLALHLIVTECHASSLLALLNVRISVRKTGGFEVHTNV